MIRNAYGKIAYTRGEQDAKDVFDLLIWNYNEVVETLDQIREKVEILERESLNQQTKIMNLEFDLMKLTTQKDSNG